MDYKIITDEEKLREFIEWLPELKNDETYYYCLFARSKYDSSGLLRGDKSQLKRGTSSKKLLIEKIKQLEIEVGRYKQNNLPIPQETLAMYISPNPRSNKVASRKLSKLLIDIIYEQNYYVDLHKEALNAIQTSRNKATLMDFDFDKVELDVVYPQLLDAVNEDAISIVKTRGGFHVLITMSKIEPRYKITWYNNISKIPGCDIRDTDGLLPIPGTYQGGFTPILYKK